MDEKAGLPAQSYDGYKGTGSTKNVAPEAFYGWLCQWVRSLEPLTEADPVALLGLGLGALGHCVPETIRVPGGHVNQLMAIAGDERAASGAAWDYVDQLFSACRQIGRRPLFVVGRCQRRSGPLGPKHGTRARANFLVRNRPEEVVARLTKPEAIWSGFAPRTLLLGVRGGSPRPLRDPIPVSVLLDAANELNPSLEFAKPLMATELRLTPEAAELWEAIYPVLREPRIAGTMIDIMTELAERQIMRLAGLYAVVDRSSEIKVEHLLAALAVWDHHEETLRELLGARRTIGSRTPSSARCGSVTLPG